MLKEYTIGEDKEEGIDTNALQIFTLGYFVFGPFSLTLVHTLLKGSSNVGNVRSVEPSGKPA